MPSVHATTRRLVTIITEAAVESMLLEDIERLGAHGYTVTEARGKGNRGARTGSWGPTANIRVEVVCDHATAAAIATHLREHYYQNYAMILFCHDVDVLRPDKF